MKEQVVLFALALLVTSLSFGQAKWKHTNSDSVLYAAAYKYIKNDSVGKKYNITVSKTLIRTYYYYWSDDIEKSNNDTLKYITDADTARMSAVLKKEFNKKTIRKLAHREKLERFDMASLNEGDTLRFTFPPIITNKQETKVNRASSDKYFDYYPSVTPESNPDEVIMYFSNIFCKEFFVEVNVGGRKWGMSYVYYFIFNKNNTIKSVDMDIAEYGA